METQMPKKVLVYFKAMTDGDENLSKVVEATEDEWRALKRTEGAEEDLFDKVYKRRGINCTIEELKKISRRIPMV
jgi:hypothetical protein